MSESISSWHFSEREQTTRLHQVEREALSTVDTTYGKGYPHYRQRGTHELAYHNGHHARDVGSKAFQLCTMLDMDPLVCETGRAAGYTHDLIQLRGRGTDERDSAAWLEGRLARQNIIHPKLRNMAAMAIIGTEPLFKNGQLVDQRANTLNYISKEAEQFAKSVASADLGELYAPQGPLLGHQLVREMNRAKQPSQISHQELISSQRWQIGLLESYTYPLPQARKPLTKYKPQVIAYAKRLLGDLEAGKVTTWQEVIERDRIFAQSLRR